MAHLFMVMLGGRHARANTEVHDVVFVWGENLEDTYPQLKKAWFGEQKGLHIDAWEKINGVACEETSYQIHLFDYENKTQPEKLFLINLGGYDQHELGELHRYVLVVAQNASIAKQRGKKYFAQHWQKQHIDRVIDVDDCVEIDQINGVYVHLVKGEFAKNEWENTYLMLDGS